MTRARVRLTRSPRYLLCALLMLAACSGTAPRLVGSEPSWRHAARPSTSRPSNPPPVTFAPSTAPAREYDGPLEPSRHTALGDAVLAAVRDAATQANVPAPVVDARLSRACAELAAVVPRTGMIDYSVEAFALQRNGIIEPSPHLLVLWQNLDDPASIVDQLRPALASLVAADARYVGVGAVRRGPEGGAIVLATQPADITTSPIPRAVAAGGSFAIDATVDAKYHDPEVFVTRETGTVDRVAIDAGHAGAFEAKVACGPHPGKLQVEITATGSLGSTVLANFPVWCGETPPPSMTFDVIAQHHVELTPDQAERELFALINRDRKAAGVPALRWDARVAAVARNYSGEMRRTGIVAHVSAISGSADDRLRAAGIASSVVLENVARDYSVSGAHAALMNSPGHRANILSPNATDAGIGVAYSDPPTGPRELFLTELFIRIPPKIDPPRAIALVRRRIERVRKVTVDPRLSAVARELAHGFAAGKAADDLLPAARHQLDAVRGSYAKVGSAVTAVADLAAVDGKALLGTGAPDAIGIGIAQGKHPQIGDGAIWIVILKADRPHPAH